MIDSTTVLKRLTLKYKKAGSVKPRDFSFGHLEAAAGDEPMYNLGGAFNSLQDARADEIMKTEVTDLFEI